MAALQACPPLDDYDYQEGGYNNYGNDYNYSDNNPLPLVDYYSYDSYERGAGDIKCMDYQYLIILFMFSGPRSTK